MRHVLIYTMLLVAATSAQADTYKCMVNGRPVYSDVPCAANARRADALEDNVPTSREIDRLRQSLKEERQLRRMDSDKRADDAQYNRRAAIADAQDRQAEAAKAARCSSARQALARAEHNIALYQDLTMQASLNRATAEKKAAEDRVFRECP